MQSVVCGKQQAMPVAMRYKLGSKQNDDSRYQMSPNVTDNVKVLNMMQAWRAAGDIMQSTLRAQHSGPSSLQLNHQH